MVNENIQGVIPLSGRGHIRRTHGNYAPGEFYSLVNAEIIDEAIVPRRPVVACGSDSHYTGNTDYHNLNEIVGHYKDGVVVSGTNKQGFIRYDGPLAMSSWDASDVITDITAEEHALNVCDWAKLVKFIRYNGTNYWMYWCAMHNGSTYWFEYWMYYQKEANPIVDDISDISTLPTTKVRVLTSNPTATESQPVISASGEPGDPGSTGRIPATPGRVASRYDAPIFFRNMFIHKDRMWLVTDKQVLFSKATDPSNWSVPEGGFFHFKEQDINDAVALKDSVYVIADNSVYIINYTSDPNALSDVTVKLLSDSIGGDSAVVIGDVVYFARDNGLYAVLNQSLSRVLDLDVRATWTDYKKWRLVPFGHYIVALYSNWTTNTNWGDVFTSTVVSNPADWDTAKTFSEGHWAASTPFYPDVDGVFDGDAFFINTENGSIHGFYTGASVVNPFQFLSSAYFCPIEGFESNNQSLFLLYKRQYNVGNTACYFYRMDFVENDPSVSAEDYIFRNDVASYTYVTEKIPFLLEVQRYCPDGANFMMKKFRNLLMEGNVPDHTFLKFNYGQASDTWGSPYVIGADLSEDFASSAILPTSIRIPINQRARALTFKMYPDTDFINAASIDAGALNISNIVVLWSYTGRAPVTSTAKVGSDSQYP